MDRKDCANWRKSFGAGPACCTASLLLACCATPARGETITLYSAALVDTPRVRLGDIAVLEGFAAPAGEQLQSLVVGDSPAPGDSIEVTLQEVDRWLARCKINRAAVRLKGASVCTIHRPAAGNASAARSASGADAASLRAQIHDHFETRLADYGGAVSLDFGDTPASLLALSAPDYTFDIVQRNERPLGLIDLQITVQGRAGVEQIERVRVRVGLTRSVVVAAQAIARGQTIARHDVKLDSRRFSRLEDIGVTRPDNIIGQEARRPLRVGDMISAQDIKSKILVKRNELLRIRSASGCIVLDSTAVALEAGALGDIIQVQNRASEDTFWAEVTGLQQARTAAANTGGPQHPAGALQ